MRMLVLALVGAFVGCASDQSNNHRADYEADMVASKVPMQQCLIAKVDTLDDGISDAKTIALALSGACNAELRRWRVAFAGTQADNRVQFDEILRRLETEQRRAEMALPWVLGNRADKRKP